jgi:hypothetical protein
MLLGRRGAGWKRRRANRIPHLNPLPRVMRERRPFTSQQAQRRCRTNHIGRGRTSRWRRRRGRAPRLHRHTRSPAAPQRQGVRREPRRHVMSEVPDSWRQQVREASYVVLPLLAAFWLLLARAYHLQVGGSWLATPLPLIAGTNVVVFGTMSLARHFPGPSRSLVCRLGEAVFCLNVLVFCFWMVATFSGSRVPGLSEYLAYRRWVP